MLDEPGVIEYGTQKRPVFVLGPPSNSLVTSSFDMPMKFFNKGNNQTQSKKQEIIEEKNKKIAFHDNHSNLALGTGFAATEFYEKRPVNIMCPAIKTEINVVISFSVNDHPLPQTGFYSK